MQVTDTQLYLAIGLPIFAIILSFIGNTIQHSSMMTRFSQMENRFSNMDSRFSNMDARMDSRFSSMETRLTHLETQMNSRFIRLEAHIETLTGKVIEIDNRLTRVEAILERR